MRRLRSLALAGREVCLEGGDVFFGRIWRLEGISTGTAARFLREDRKGHARRVVGNMVSAHNSVRGPREARLEQ